MNLVKPMRLGDLITFKRGYDLPEKNRVFGSYPVISSAGVSGYHNEYKAEGEGVVTGRYGTLGKMYYVDGKYWPHNTALYVKDFKGNDPQYIYYLLTCIGHINTSDKSAVPGVNRNEMHDMAVPAIEDKKIQISVRTLLKSIDKKIELNNKINTELEAMAKLIYDYWFVQFDFPDANGKPYKSSGGKMVYNEALKREIPDGWESKYLSELSDKIGDGIHGTPKYTDYSEFSFINGNNLKNGFIHVNEETKNITTEEHDKYFIKLDGNTILLSINGTLGNLAVYTDEKVMLGKSSAYINCFEGHRAFCYQYLKQKHIQKNFWNIASGSTIKNLSLGSLKNLKLVYPGLELVAKFNDVVHPIEDKRENIFKENQKLTELRDWLLPMLMNGQVTVKDSE